MIKRIIEITEIPATLKIKDGCVEIQLEKGEIHRVPPAEIEVLILGTVVVSVSGALLATLSRAGVCVVVSGDNHMPCGMLLPLEGNYVQTERFAAQSAAPLPLKKRMWQSVVAAKLRSQGELLMEVNGDDCGLLSLAGKVKSGDTDNLEARGAVIYWKKLFAEPFLRERTAPDNNSLLNYGYAVLRAMVARAICGAGLHPTVGISHHNRYNAFCLADDLMEPFRAVVDRAVRELHSNNALREGLTREERREIISAIQQHRLYFRGKIWKLSDVIVKVADLAASSFISGENHLEFGRSGDWTS